MFWRKKPNIYSDDEVWLLSCWSWLDARFGPVSRQGHPGLVLPDRKTFPRSTLTGQPLALHYLTAIQQLWSMAEWPVTLIEQEPRRELPVSVAFAGMASRGALGTYSRSGNAAQITYDPGLLERPMQLIATLAHELAHYRLQSAGTLLPGGAAMEEFATDLTVSHFGFGLFGANSARTFKAYTDYDRQGWSNERAGYLTENEWTFSLALFTHQRSIPAGDLKPHLKDYLFSGFRKNRAYVDATPDLLGKAP